MKFLFLILKLSFTAYFYFHKIKTFVQIKVKKYLKIKEPLNSFAKFSSIFILTVGLFLFNQCQVEQKSHDSVTENLTEIDSGNSFNNVLETLPSVKGNGQGDNSDIVEMSLHETTTDEIQTVNNHQDENNGYPYAVKTGLELYGTFKKLFKNKNATLLYHEYKLLSVLMPVSHDIELLSKSHMKSIIQLAGRLCKVTFTTQSPATLKLGSIFSNRYSPQTWILRSGDKLTPKPFILLKDDETLRQAFVNVMMGLIFDEDLLDEDLLDEMRREYLIFLEDLIAQREHNKLDKPIADLAVGVCVAMIVNPHFIIKE